MAAKRKEVAEEVAKEGEAVDRRRKSTMDDVVILTNPDPSHNPRRPGTDAHRHYEQMRGEPTIREYLMRFPEGERKNARAWLSNTVAAEKARIHQIEKTEAEAEAKGEAAAE